LLIQDDDDPEGDFFDFVKSQIDNLSIPEAISPEDDWWACLRAIGVSKELQEAIMDPEFTDLLYIASCKFWVLDAIEARYKSLVTFDDRLRKAAVRFEHMPSRTRGPSTTS
jgi:hypothetical protein